MSGSGRPDRFAVNTDGYARFRPGYPASLLARLREAILAMPDAAALPVADIGSGTGIFTRQLAGILPPAVEIVGVEPSRPMRDEALRTLSGDRIRYIDGAAEKLPFADGTIGAVTAATAAHWFDFPAFLGEAKRVLATGGVLAIADYIRDVERSPAAAALETFLGSHGGEKAYVRPDYAAELADAPGLSNVSIFGENVVLDLTPEDFIGLGLSSSHARAVEARLGRKGTRRRLAELAASLKTSRGAVPYGYQFRMFIARKIDPDRNRAGRATPSPTRS